MAPDLNILESFKTDGYATNGVPRHDYEIPDTVLFSPTIRKLRVICIGAGLSGIISAYRIQKELENIDFSIYEKNAKLGGTWLENRYPGCACDVPSHAYQMPFALNPDWPRFFSYSPDIWAYFNKVCEVFKLHKYMQFNSEVVECCWQQDLGQWKVRIKQTASDGSTKILDDYCHVLLQGSGLLNRWKWPDISGLDDFKGRVVHTAHWPSDYQKEEWKNDRVAVIGSGASSIQTVPTMQPHAKHIDIFVRTGVWFVGIAENYGHNHEYTDEQKAEFHGSSIKLVEHAKSLEDQLNGLWGGFYRNSEAGKLGKKIFSERMADFIKDQRLLEGFTPKWGVGCRRITPGDPYMLAIQEPNVDVHFTGVKSVSQNGVIGDDGIEREVDTIVCATGFDVTYRPHFPIIGQNGVSLSEKWKVVPEGYMGVAIPDFPNLIWYVGPNFPVENGSFSAPLYAATEYAMKMIKKIQTENIRSIAPRQDVTDEFNEHCQEWVRHTVWTEDCRSWYRNNETGRVNAVWPGSSLHYMEAIETPRYEDFEIEYLGASAQNRWAYLGLGNCRAQVENKDVSPYYNTDDIDPEWAKALKISRRDAINAKIEKLKKELELLDTEEGAKENGTTA